MKKIFFSLATLAVVAGITIGGTLAWFNDTKHQNNNTLATGVVQLGEMYELPFNIDNLAPGKSFTHDMAIQYDGNLIADLYIGVQAQSGTDLGEVLEYRIQKMEEGWTNGGWFEGSAWKAFTDYPTVMSEYLLTYEGLEEGDWARARLHIRMKSPNDYTNEEAEPDWNTFQGVTEKVRIIFHAVQKESDAPTESPRDYDPSANQI